jgi:hypothetical protein
MTGKQIVFGLFIVILIAFSASLFAQATKKTCIVTAVPEGAGEKRIEKRIIMKRCGEDLGLTPEQQIKMIDIRFDHKLEVLAIKRDLIKKGIELKAEMDKEEPSQPALDKIADDMALLQARMKKSDMHCVLAAKALLTKEQWLKAKDRITDECMGWVERRDEPDCCGGSQISFFEGGEEPKDNEKRIKIIKMGDPDEPLVIRAEEEDD